MLFEILHCLIFTLLLIDTVRLMPAIEQILVGRKRPLQPGFHYTLLAARLTRNVTGLLTLPLLAVADPAVREFLPLGIALFLSLAAIHLALSQARQALLASWSGDRTAG